MPPVLAWLGLVFAGSQLRSSGPHKATHPRVAQLEDAAVERLQTFHRSHKPGFDDDPRFEKPNRTHWTAAHLREEGHRAHGHIRELRDNARKAFGLPGHEFEPQPPRKFQKRHRIMDRGVPASEALSAHSRRVGDLHKFLWPRNASQHVLTGLPTPRPQNDSQDEIISPMSFMETHSGMSAHQQAVELTKLNAARMLAKVQSSDAMKAWDANLHAKFQEMKVSLHKLTAERKHDNDVAASSLIQTADARTSMPSFAETEELENRDIAEMNAFKERNLAEIAAMRDGHHSVRDAIALAAQNQAGAAVQAAADSAAHRAAQPSSFLEEVSEDARPRHRPFPRRPHPQFRHGMHRHHHHTHLGFHGGDYRGTGPEREATGGGRAAPSPSDLMSALDHFGLSPALERKIEQQHARMDKMFEKVQVKNKRDGASFLEGTNAPTGDDLVMHSLRKIHEAEHRQDQAADQRVRPPFSQQSGGGGVHNQGNPHV